MSDEPTPNLVDKLARAIEAAAPETGRLRRIEMSRSMFDQLHRAMFRDDVPEGCPDLWSSPLHVVDGLHGHEIRLVGTVTVSVPASHTCPVYFKAGETA